MKFNELYYILFEDSIPGGKSDKHTINTLAKKYNTSATIIRKAVRTGIAVELEHTSSRKKAREIAMDHIAEKGPKYYKALKKMEEHLP